MISFKMHRFRVVIVILILLLSIILKFHNYDKYPQRGATSDEYTYAFLGVSLLTKHIPISWSTFSIYENRSDLTIKGIYFPIVWPYFDHPPLHGILVGSFALLFGQDTFTKIELSTIRIVPIILSFLSSLLLFAIANKLYGYKTGVWALLIYTTTTIFVMNSRVVMAENLVTLLLLSALYLYILNQSRIKVKQIVFIGVLVGLSIWTKTLGVMVFLSMLYIFLVDKLKLKYVVLLSAIFFAFVALYVGYGYIYDFDTFLKANLAQSGRNIGPQSLLMLTIQPVIVNKVFYDGWYFFGIFAILTSFLDFKKNRFVIIPSIIYLLVLISSLTREGQSGWYMIVMFPFMALASAKVLVESIENKQFVFAIFILFIGLFQIQNIYEENFGLTNLIFRFFILLLFVPFFAAFVFKGEKLFKILANFWFYTFILGNIFLTYNYIHPS